MFDLACQLRHSENALSYTCMLISRHKSGYLEYTAARFRALSWGDQNWALLFLGSILLADSSYLKLRVGFGKMRALFRAFAGADVFEECDGGESAEAACPCGINRLRVR